MTPRELWRRIMFYGEFDRIPVIHWAPWTETRERWISEGLPADVGEHEVLDAVPLWVRIPVDHGLYPPFEPEVLEETDEYRILRDEAGVMQKDWKHKSCIPTFLDHTLKSAKDWDGFRERLQPDPARVPENLDETVREAEASGLPVQLGLASLMGQIRNWMGVQNMSYLMYDDPDCYADMVNTLADLACWGVDQVAPRLSEPADVGHGWEDICGKAGPLVSPMIFERCVAQGYRKMREKLESYGVTLMSIDTDGDIRQLIGPWFEAGVNVQFPVEIGTWNADPMAYRRQFGKELRIIGGFNKLTLEQGPAAIDAEIERRAPLIKDGGYLMMPDHLIQPGVSLANYRYYLDRVRNLRV